MAAVLQPPEDALDAGLSQPDGLRKKKAWQQREARRIMAQLRETLNAGKVKAIQKIVRYANPAEPSSSWKEDRYLFK